MAGVPGSFFTSPVTVAVDGTMLEVVDATWTVTGHYYTRSTALCTGLPGSAGTRKVKPIRILLNQETASEPLRNFEANQAQLTARFRYVHFISDNRYLKKTCFTQMASKFIIRVYIIYIVIHR